MQKYTVTESNGISATLVVSAIGLVGGDNGPVWLTKRGAAPVELPTTVLGAPALKKKRPL